MSATGGGYRLHWCSEHFQFRNLYAGLAGNIDQMLPCKSVRPLGGKLVAKRHRIMVIKQDEMVANSELEKGLNNEPVFHGARNGTHVHDFVWADEGFS